MTEDDVDTIVQHLHCPVCGKAVPPDEEFCSEECEERMNNLVKKRKLVNYIWLAIIMAFMFILFLSIPFQQG